MEFPSLGKNCFEETCNKLDFLPVQCDSCDNVFCSDHYSYAKHSCPGACKNDVQVPVCPLCGEPVPTPRGVSPDQVVGQHMDQYCKPNTKKIFTNRCSFKNCKRKELIPVTCSLCKQNFCLRHRHTADHECGSPQNIRNLAANAAEQRTQKNRSANLADGRGINNQSQSIQGNMTEDEALAHALALSIMELDESTNQNRRVQQSPEVTVGGQRYSKDKCSLS